MENPDRERELGYPEKLAVVRCPGCGQELHEYYTEGRDHEGYWVSWPGEHDGEKVRAYMGCCTGCGFSFELVSCRPVPKRETYAPQRS